MLKAYAVLYNIVIKLGTTIMTPHMLEVGVYFQWGPFIKATRHFRFNFWKGNMQQQSQQQ